MRILLVEDETDLAGSIQAVLQDHGHVVDHCVSGQDAWVLLGSDQARYELGIFDWMLPDLSGLDLCRRARSRGLELPLLLLTARGDTADRVEGLDAGADDYLSKPFAMEELLARVRALQRRHPSYRAPVLEAGCFRLDLATGQLVVTTATAEMSIELTTKEQQLMSYLMDHPGQVISGSRLRNQLWNLQQDPISNVVAAQVRLLRRKLAAHGLASPIETVPSKGYRLNPHAAVLL